MILRVAPHYPILSWSTGPYCVEFMHVYRRDVPQMVSAIARHVLDRGHGVRAFLA